MKRYLTLITLLITFCSYGQLITKAGFVISSIKFSDDLLLEGERIEARGGFTVGAAFNGPLGGNFSLQPELNFIQKGANSKVHYEDAEFILTSEARVSIYYIEIPLLLRYEIDAGAQNLYFTAGPSVALGFGGHHSYKRVIEFESGGVDRRNIQGKVKFGTPPSNTDDAYINHNKELSLQLGTGILLNEKLAIDVRYGLGLTNLVADADQVDTKSRNRAFQITFGIVID